MQKTDNQLAPDTINNLLDAVNGPMALLAGMQLDIFSPLGKGPCNAATVAKELDVNPQKLSLLLYALVVANLLTVDKGEFSNTPETTRFLVKSSPDYMGSVHELISDFWSAMLKTSETLRTGLPQAKHDFDAMSTEDLGAMMRGLHGGALGHGYLLAEHLDLAQYKHLVDVGGGSGGITIAACESCPNLRATVVDLPKTVDIAAEFLAEAGMTERVELEAVDVTKFVPEGDFDVAVLRSMLQILSPEQAKKVVENVSHSLASGGTIVILGIMVDDSRLSPPGAAAFNLVFMNFYDDGRCYTESEQRGWLEAAGFVNIRRETLPDGAQLITARKG